MRLDDATKKMSKSDKTNKGIIFLTDSPDMIDKKIMKAKTDSNGKVINKLKILFNFRSLTRIRGLNFKIYYVFTQL